ncbi:MULTISPECIES: 2Fe-2S iron-sulfur cluster-binding protein [unclassified Amycolatopsis]|uniref:2Fe-2S iron-sulfur cluster-binding protein n=1 Tax=unclassified Amycolatopsis TaxID=2618356 RepID=UPI002877074C|nr:MULTISPECIES: 2Fe-2S iron-sulfur cluster-binding protein [unclassified Amycolatopsis]MDS0132117.1 (2Fe-2S)-binding protein [Amycolatopsis sp. 505]MDS0141145.1 (2Fe-2S)-binding protein [Amycolatopsis sp. CM201R]
MTRLSGVPLKFTFDGRELTGYLGDTLASALLANGVHHVATSIKYGRPRGIVGAGVEDSNALVQIEKPFPEPMLSATTVELYDGLEARGLRGQGRLATEPDPARYDAKHAHCDVLVIGAGPAGRAAAAAAEGRVLLVDDQPDGEAPEGVRFLSRTTAFGVYDDGFVLALERRGEPPERISRQRVWRIRAKRIVVATGAHERPIVFPDNDRPGIMLASAARTYLNRYGVLAGRRVVVFTTNDSAYEAASDLAAAGAEIVRIVDAREGHGVIGTDGDTHITAAHVAGLGELQGERVECDLLLVSGGWNPAVHLYSQARGTLRYAPELGAYVPAGDLPDVTVVGAAAGEGLPETKVLWQVPAPESEVDTRFVDQQRDATVSDVLRATGAGLRSLEHVKRYTTIGTAHDQGKTSGMLAAGITAEALGVDLAHRRPTTFRPPYTPVPFAALAGRNRGDLHDPVRVTTIHPWHVEHGAEFENVGQWKRPWYYPRPGEPMADAVKRECRAARNDVACMDGSTLGKIDVQGPDAGWFLDMLYTNLMSNLKVGRIRYGVMCGVDGMVIDDGTVIRVGEERFLVTTTTGNAAKVLEWMEEWLQTEWPHRRVDATSVTEHWTTIPLVGPRSREVLGRLAPGLDVSNEAFGFMTWQDAEVAGLRARVCRISFSGELAYEINVPSWHGPALWQAVVDQGATPYGTETMHVLRAEKGYPIIGQDTDGTVTPQDLGMSWAVSKKKADFIGKRSFARAENNRPDRKQLVGLLPVDPAVLLPEGSQIIESETVPEPPVRMLGHVTSSYDSAALGRTFALALVRSGRERIGETLYVPVGDQVVPVTVTESVLFDKEGARRDG